MQSEDHYIEKTIKAVGKAINRYGLIKKDDRVAVALSGGTDSLVLLESLALRKKRLPIDYFLAAVHVEISEGFYRSDRGHLEEFCGRLGVPLVWRTISLGIDADFRETPCFICSKKRRNELFKAADELDCRSLAFGHHMDDAIETLMLNMVFSGSMSSMPPSLEIFGGALKIIRPLILITGEDVKRYAGIRGFKGQMKECRFGGDTKRNEMRRIIAEFQHMNKKARANIFRAMSNIHEMYLPPRKTGQE
mgnify:CR=1 FL=1